MDTRKSQRPFVIANNYHCFTVFVFTWFIFLGLILVCANIFSTDYATLPRNLILLGVALLVMRLKKMWRVNVDVRKRVVTILRLPLLHKEIPFDEIKAVSLSPAGTCAGEHKFRVVGQQGAYLEKRHYDYRQGRCGAVR